MLKFGCLWTISAFVLQFPGFCNQCPLADADLEQETSNSPIPCSHDLCRNQTTPSPLPGRGLLLTLFQPCLTPVHPPPASPPPARVRFAGLGVGGTSAHLPRSLTKLPLFSSRKRFQPSAVFTQLCPGDRQSCPRNGMAPRADAPMCASTRWTGPAGRPRGRAARGGRSGCGGLRGDGLPGTGVEGCGFRGAERSAGAGGGQRARGAAPGRGAGLAECGAAVRAALFIPGRWPPLFVAGRAACS